MKPRTKLAETTAPNGESVALYEHDGAFAISFRGQELMHSKASTSESLLGSVAVERLSERTTPRVLIGGLGLGYTLRGALDQAPADSTIEVAELIHDIIDWNRSHLRDLNGACLDDPRAQIRIEDVTEIIRAAPAAHYDAIALDVDNGPIALVSPGNFSLYSNAGLRAIKTALWPRGRAVFWSAGPDLKFETRLRKAGFDIALMPAKVHPGAKRAAYLLFVADLPD